MTFQGCAVFAIIANKLRKLFVMGIGIASQPAMRYSVKHQGGVKVLLTFPMVLVLPANELAESGVMHTATVRKDTNLNLFFSSLLQKRCNSTRSRSMLS
jgi:hypothetical protein